MSLNASISCSRRAMRRRAMSGFVELPRRVYGWLSQLDWKDIAQNAIGALLAALFLWFIGDGG